MNNDRYTVVADPKLVKDFFSTIRRKTFNYNKTVDDTSYFVFTVFRKKKLPEDFKNNLRKFGLTNRSWEVCYHKSVHNTDSDHVLRKLYEFEVPYEALTYTSPETGEKFHLPQDALATYVCMNPTNLLDMIITMGKNIIEYMGEIIKGKLKDEQFKKLLSVIESRSKYMTSICKHWIDIDIDCKERKDEVEQIIKQAASTWDGFDVHGILIKTLGGFHFLISRSTLKNNPNDIAKFITEKLSESNIKFDEVLYKADVCAVPIPGTVQYNKCIVTYKEI